MKIALVSPKSAFLGRSAEFNDFLKQSPEMEFYRQYWSGLGSGLLVIGALTPKDVEIELIDENIEDIDFNWEEFMPPYYLMRLSFTLIVLSLEKLKTCGQNC